MINRAALLIIAWRWLGTTNQEHQRRRGDGGAREPPLLPTAAPAGFQYSRAGAAQICKLRASLPTFFSNYFEEKLYSARGLAPSGGC
jgi:hypothetical protein